MIDLEYTNSSGELISFSAAQKNEEVTLEVLVALSKIELPSQEQEEEESSEELTAAQQKAKDLQKRIDEAQYKAQYSKYCAEFVSVACKIPLPDIVGTWDLSELLYIYKLLCKAIEEPNYSTYTEEQIEQLYKPFIFNGSKWFFPARFMLDSTVQNLVEAAQLEKESADINEAKYSALAGVCACLLRKNDPAEGFNEQEFEERKEAFGGLTLDKAYLVGFFLQRQNEFCRKVTLTCLESQLKQTDILKS